MNIHEIEARLGRANRNIGTLNDLKIYINYLIKEEKTEQVEEYLNSAIKLAGDLGLPREEGTLLIELGVHYWNQLDYKSALNMFRLSCGIFKQSKNEYDLVVATHNVGETYTKIGDYNNAISFLKLSLDFLGKVKGHDRQEVEELCADINDSLGTAFRKCKSYALSMSAYFRALELQERHNLKTKLCHTYLNIGKMFVSLGNFERALKYFNNAVEIALINNDLQLKAKTYALIGKLYRKKNKYSQAIPFYLEAIGYLQQSKNKDLFNKIRIIYDLSLVYKEMEDYDNVIKECYKGLDLLHESDYQILKSKFKKLLGESLMIKQDFQQAKEILYSALEDIATEDTANTLKYNILTLISTIFAQQNSHDKAYKTLVKSNEYIDLMIQENQEKTLQELEARFESQQKVREEIMLKKTNQEVVDLKEKVNSLSLLLKDYEDIDNFFGVIPKDKIMETIEKHKHIHTQHGIDFLTLKLKLISPENILKEDISRILKDISKLVMFYLRKNDEVGHWGNDALVIILSDMKAESVDKVIEKIKMPIYNDILNKEPGGKYKVEFEVME